MNKKLAGLIILMLLVETLSAQTTYHSVGTGNWSSASNWNPSTAIPGEVAGDIVIIDNGTNITLDVTPANAIADLTVGNGSSGVLQFADCINEIDIKVSGAITINTGAYFGASQTLTTTCGSGYSAVGAVFNANPMVINGTGVFNSINFNKAAATSSSVVLQNGDYRTKAPGSGGLWSAVGTWQYINGINGWANATVVPNSAVNPPTVWIRGNNVNSGFVAPVVIDMNTEINTLIFSGSGANTSKGGQLVFINSGNTAYTLTVNKNIVLGGSGTSGSGLTSAYFKAAATNTLSPGVLHKLKIGGYVVVASGNGTGAVLDFTPVGGVSVLTQFTGANSIIYPSNPAQSTCTFDSLKVNDGAILTAKNSFTVKGSLTVGQGGSASSFRLYDTSAVYTIVIGNGITVKANASLTSAPIPTMSANHVLTVTGNIVNNGTIDLRITGSGFTSSVNMTLGTGAAGNYNYSGSGTSNFSDFTLNLASGSNLTLLADMNVAGILGLKSGILNLNANNLTVLTKSSTAIINGTGGNTFSTANMIQADGTGKLIRAITGSIGSNTAYLFPIGDVTSSTPHYSPVTINFLTTNAGNSNLLGINVTAAAHPNIGGSSAYLTRYWKFSGSGLSSYSYSASFGYPVADVFPNAGAESNLKVSRYSGSGTTWNNSPWTSSALSGVMSSSGTALTESSAPLIPSGVFTGRSDGNCPSPAINLTASGQNVCTGGSGAVLSVSCSSNCTGISYAWSPSAGLSLTSGTAVIANPLTPGTYTYFVTGTNNGGCVASQQVIINVGEAPAIPSLINGNFSVCAGRSAVSYSVDAMQGVTGYNWTLPTGVSIATGSNTNSITVNYSLSAISGTITVAATNSCGSGNPSVHSVMVHPAPTIVVNSSSNQVCVGSAVKLKASGALTYSWLPTTELDSPVGDSVLYTPVAAGAVTYTVTGTDMNGCSGKGNAVVTAEVCTSIDATVDSDIKVYPNPVTGKKLMLTFPVNPGSTVIQVFDMAGNKLIENKMVNAEQQQSLNLPSAIPAGIYIMQVISSKVSACFKIVVAGSRD